MQAVNVKKVEIAPCYHNHFIPSFDQVVEPGIEDSVKKSVGGDISVMKENESRLEAERIALQEENERKMQEAQTIKE